MELANNLKLATTHPPPLDMFFPTMLAALQGQMLCAAALTLLLWDILITLDQEVEYIWKSRPRMTLVKFLYFLNRFTRLIAFQLGAISFCISLLKTAFESTVNHTMCSFLILNNGSLQAWSWRNLLGNCRDLGIFVFWSQIVNINVLEAALAIRVWAIYQRSSRVMWFLIFILSGSVVSMTIVFGLDTEVVQQTRILKYPQYLYGCNKVNFPLPTNYDSIYYSAFVLENFGENQVIFFTMTIIQAVRHGRSDRRTPLMDHIVRNGTMFFLLATVAISFAVVGSFLPTICSPSRDSNIIIAVLSMNGSRLILSLRDKAYNAPLPSLHVPTELMGPQLTDERDEDKIVQENPYSNHLKAATVERNEDIETGLRDEGLSTPELEKRDP
ncbi:hypothetical protein K439DRAFT_1614653 [Ramaria rubella]|nr:hypothetical protein K439DRAFT_1614653 [Ramaria rubella]